MTFAILGSLGADHRARDLREVQDELLYLAGQLSFALNQDADGGATWPDALWTEGSRPAGAGEAAALADFLAPELFLPADPNERAYAVRRLGPKAWLISAQQGDRGLIALDDEAALQKAREDGTAVDVRLP